MSLSIGSMLGSYRIDGLIGYGGMGEVYRASQAEGLPRPAAGRWLAVMRRRTEVVGSFPNEDAINRLVGALLLGQNDAWVVQRARYTTLKIIAPLNDDSTITLPAVATWPTQPKPATTDEATLLHHAQGHDHRGRASG